jgi:hypothetical protein
MIHVFYDVTLSLLVSDRNWALTFAAVFEQPHPFPYDRGTGGL